MKQNQHKYINLKSYCFVFIKLINRIDFCSSKNKQLKNIYKYTFCLVVTNLCLKFDNYPNGVWGMM